MKKVALSALAAAMISGIASADALTLYSDPKTGQVYTTAGEGRVEMGDFISAKEVDMAQREAESKFSEYQDKQKKYVNVKSKAKTLEFSGTHYLGFTTSEPTTQSSTAGRSSGFEMRRNYLQVKAFFNDKDYARVTMDTTKELASYVGTAEDTGTDNLKTSQGGGYADMFVKYAYLYLDNILPYTGVEMGIVHRPWIDYEEHNSWHYRSFNKVALEEKSSATTVTETGLDLVNSADFGINFKTKTENFSSEIGVFNGEGYHGDKIAGNQQNDSRLSVEWRLTGHLIGSGEKVGKADRTKDTYAQISTLGLVSHNHKDNAVAIGDAAEYDRSFYGIHAVYNQPEFLLAAQYVKAEDDVRISTGTDLEYDLFSINAEIRPFTDWTIIGRYDDYKKENKTAAGVKTVNYEGEKKIVALAYKYNKNVSFIGTAKYCDEKNGAGVTTAYDKDIYMLTTELKW
ncbi:hypothetical protein [Sulfuricurvum sp.]|uniref:hypothetical protein n=1 Tax=Sulfuricurvum sp. TaxID=2025608 RepID=UPI003BB6CB25